MMWLGMQIQSRSCFTTDPTLTNRVEGLCYGAACCWLSKQAYASSYGTCGRPCPGAIHCTFTYYVLRASKAVFRQPTSWSYSVTCSCMTHHRGSSCGALALAMNHHYGFTQKREKLARDASELYFVLYN